MRFDLIIELKETFIEKDYRPLVVSIFKGCILNNAGKDVLDELYAPAQKKDLNWSISFNKPDFSGSFIKLASNKVYINLSFKEAKTAFIYFSSLMANIGKSFPMKNNNSAVIKSVKMKQSFKIRENTVVFKLYSPLCLREHDRITNKDKYFTIEEEGFAEKLFEDIKENMQPNNSVHLENLLVDYSRLKKTVVKLYGQNIHVSVGEIVMKGDVELLNDIYNNGLGSRKSLGFGLLGVI